MSTDFNFLLKRGVSEIISEEELLKLLSSGKKLRLKEGFDPSSTDIHMGQEVLSTWTRPDKRSAEGRSRSAGGAHGVTREPTVPRRRVRNRLLD